MRTRRLDFRNHIAVALVAACACAMTATLPGAVTSAAGEPTASSAQADVAGKRKTCRRGKIVVRRPGRSSVCAKKCRAGFKRKVSKKGKVSCVKKRRANGAPGNTPSPGPTPPGSSGPASGNYSGTTEQGRPVTFTVSGSQVTGYEAGVNTYCTTQGNQRIVFDAIANVPPMAIAPDGSFSYSGGEDNGNAEIRGRIVGSSATGTVGMNRGDTNYQGGQLYFGSCSAADVPWSAAPG